MLPHLGKGKSAAAWQPPCREIVQIAPRAAGRM
jgi:hypothetical protein